MSWPQLRNHLQTVTGNLSDELERIRTGKRWRNYLHLNKIKNTSLSQTGPPKQESVKQLRKIVNRFDEVSNKEEYKTISSKPAFQATRTTLDELLVAPRKRTRRALTTSHQELEQSLARYPSGSRWMDYLALPERLTDSLDNRRQTTLAMDQAEELLERYERVNNDAKLTMVAQQPGFQATRKHLADYVRSLQAALVQAGSNSK